MNDFAQGSGSASAGGIMLRCDCGTEFIMAEWSITIKMLYGVDNFVLAAVV